MQQNGLELCRKKSLTPEPSSTRNSSLNRTPIGSSLYLHSRVSRPSSLAASPVVERVLEQMNTYGFQQSQKQQRARRSLPQQVAQQLEAAGLLTPRVLEQAAESIVYDLVRFDSPTAPTHGLIDPNSSFGNII